MTELIDKGKLLEYLSAIKPDEYVSSYGEAAVDVINHVEEYVNAMPTIEPEVRHGRWEEIGGYEPENHGFACSVCDFATMVKSRFCPNCGARMDGGADNG